MIAQRNLAIVMLTGCVVKKDADEPDKNPKCTAKGGACADKNKDKCGGDWKRGCVEVAVLLSVVLGR